MGWDKERVLREEYAIRTKEVRVEALRGAFDGDEPVFTVRALTANELAGSEEARQSRSQVLALTKALERGEAGELSRAMQGYFGVASDDVKPDFARRLEIVARGVVAPENWDKAQAVWLAEKFPVAFYELSNEILTLTGLGAEAQKKPPPSGETRPSEGPSH